MTSSSPPASGPPSAPAAIDTEVDAAESTDVDATVLSPEQAQAERLPSGLDDGPRSPPTAPSASQGSGTDGTRSSATLPEQGAAPSVAATPPTRPVRPGVAEAPSTAAVGVMAGARPVSSSKADDELGALPVVDPGVYDVIRPYARGGIGEILEAWDRRLNRVVAIKKLRRSTGYARLRFAREVSITAMLQHPNIIPVYEAGRWLEGGPFLAMKLVDGGSLEQAIAAAASTEERLRLLRNVADVADALGYAHSQAVVHRDLKPSNVLLGPFGETVVIDWGLAKVLDDDSVSAMPAAGDEGLVEPYRTKDGVVMGTPHYMPPEQAAGPAVDARADVYALGAMLYQVLTGRPPYFEAQPRHVLTRLAEGPPTSIDELCPEAPPDLRAIVRKAMARRPEERYRTAGEMAQELGRFLTGGLVSAHQYSMFELVRRFVGRHRTAVLTAAFAALVVVLVAAYSFATVAGERDRAERSARAEAEARRAAEQRLALAQLARARTALGQDPTASIALLRGLDEPLAGAATVAADAVERGVARHVLAGHEDHVDALAISPDHRWVASGGADRAVWLWDLAAGTGRRLGLHDDRVAAIGFSADGETLATGGYDHRLVLWQVATGAQRVLAGHRGPIKALALSSEGRLASVGSAELRLWDVATGRAQVFSCPADRSRFAQFSPDGRKLLTGSHGGALRLWDVASGVYRTLEGRGGEVRAAVLLDGQGRLAWGGEDGTLWIWSPNRAAPEPLGVHAGGIASLASFPDGARVVTGGLDGAVRIWQVGSGDYEVVQRHGERVSSVAVSSDGRWIASGSWDRTVGLIDVVTGDRSKLRGHHDVVSVVRFSADVGWLASASWDRRIRLWPVEPTGRRVLAAHRVGAKTVAFSPDGTMVASGGHDDTVAEWNAASGDAVRRHRGHGDHVFRVRFSPDGTWIASSSDDRSVRLWRAGTDEQRVLRGHRADVEEICFSPDGRWLASAGEDDAIGLWDVSSGDGRMMTGHDGPVTALVCLPDGRTLASASTDGTVRLWDTVAAKRLAVLYRHEGPVTGLAGSADGQTLASASPADGVRLWDRVQRRGSRPGTAVAERWPTVGADRVAVTPQGDLVAAASPRGDVWLCNSAGGPCRRMPGHSARIYALSYARDGKLLVTASGDGTLRVFDVATGESRPLRGHAGPVFDAALSPDERTIASASADGTVRLWPLLPPPKPAALEPWLVQLTSAPASGTRADSAPSSDPR